MGKPSETPLYQDTSTSATTRFLTYVLDYCDLRKMPNLPICLRLNEALVIGRSDDSHAVWSADSSELRLPGEWLSREHARIIRKKSGDVLLDRGSKNGTFVNGVRVHEHVLVDRDLIEVGHVLLCYRNIDPHLAAVLSTSDRRVGPTSTRSPEVAMLLHNLQILAKAQRPLLLLGETGTGKEVAACQVHAWSGRPGAFVALDCGAVPDSLFEGRLFGHIRGAYTGAVTTQTGEILRADRGTLFLDEVGNLSESAQGKLLRVMEEGTVTQLGSTQASQVDVRWLAATNVDLHDPRSAFRRDLLRRLGTVQKLLPLRQRREDLGELCSYFLGSDAAPAQFPRVAITPEAGRRLFCDPLPGNIRQLREVLLSAALLAGSGPIAVQHLLSADPSLAASRPPEPPTRKGRPCREELEAALRCADGHRAQAAALLGTTERQLYRWLRAAKL